MGFLTELLDKELEKIKKPIKKDDSIRIVGEDDD